MIKIPFMEVRPGVLRPIFAVQLTYQGRFVVVDGLLDTGADRTLIPPYIVSELGVDTTRWKDTHTMTSATGHPLICKQSTMELQLARDHEVVRWSGEVAIPTNPIPMCYWGFKGFLEFFVATFDGPGRAVTLKPGKHFPGTVSRKRKKRK